MRGRLTAGTPVGSCSFFPAFLIRFVSCLWLTLVRAIGRNVLASLSFIRYDASVWLGLAAGSTEAAVTLRNLLNAEADNIKLGAARSILEIGNRLREWAELEERIAALEQRIAGRARR